MTRTPIEQLQLSVRTTNVLHRMGIHHVEELIETSLEVIAQQRNIGAKTLDEIKSVIENANDIIEYLPPSLKGFGIICNSNAKMES